MCCQCTQYSLLFLAKPTASWDNIIPLSYIITPQKESTPHGYLCSHKTVDISLVPFLHIQCMYTVMWTTQRTSSVILSIYQQKWYVKYEMPYFCCKHYPFFRVHILCTLHMWEYSILQIRLWICNFRQVYCSWSECLLPWCTAFGTLLPYWIYDFTVFNMYRISWYTLYISHDYTVALEGGPWLNVSVSQHEPVFARGFTYMRISYYIMYVSSVVKWRALVHMQQSITRT